VVQDHLTVPCDDISLLVTKLQDQRRLTAMNLQANPSIIVIGAGPVGLYTAYVLASVGCHVQVIDNGRRGAGWASGGMLGAAYEVLCDASIAKPIKTFARGSQWLWSKFLSASDAPVVQGSVFVARGDDERARLDDLITVAPDFSVTAQPWEVPQGIVGQQALFCPEEIAFDPRFVLRLLAQECANKKVTIKLGDVTSVETGVVTLSDGVQMRADLIVVATGQAGSALCHSVPELAHLTPVKGQVLAIGGSGVLLNHAVRAGRVYLIPRGDLIVVGATSNRDASDLGTFDQGEHSALLNEAIALCPALRQGRVVESWAGLRPMTPDGLPLIGRSQKSGILIAAGTYRNGWLYAAGIANSLMGMVLEDEAAPANLQLFAPNRFPT
jgi:glycine oxidase